MKKYLSTVGLLASHEKFKRPTLVRVCFECDSEGDTVEVSVISGRNLATIDKLGKKTITRLEFRDMPDDPYDDIVFARAAFSLFGLEI